MQPSPKASHFQWDLKQAIAFWTSRFSLKAEADMAGLYHPRGFLPCVSPTSPFIRLFFSEFSRCQGAASLRKGFPLDKTLSSAHPSLPCPVSNSLKKDAFRLNAPEGSASVGGGIKEINHINGEIDSFPHHFQIAIPEHKALFNVTVVIF